MFFGEDAKLGEGHAMVVPENAFWGHPIRDFFGPFFNAAKHSLGWKGIPEHIEERRDLEEYFDILKYVKFTKYRI